MYGYQVFHLRVQVQPIRLTQPVHGYHAVAELHPLRHNPRTGYSRNILIAYH